MYKSIIRPIFFLFQPEPIHHFTFNFLKIVFKIPGVFALVRAMFKVEDPKLNRKVMGLEFANPVGLAAGFDKEAKLYEELGALGFGFVEIGTLTPKAQPGNPKPRIFRVVDDQGVINRMGFNNEGVEEAVERLKHRKSNVLIGGNIGKNKVTPNENAVYDYIQCFDALYPYVDYFVVNVSSPNTPGLRDLQEKEPLTKLLKTLQELNDKKGRKPLALKIAPDLTDSQLDDIVEIAENVKLDAVIATNTTISRDGLRTPAKRIEEIGAGGLSGAPVRARSTEVIQFLRNKMSQDISIIAVGGIFTGEDAMEKLQAGADLIQVYTGFIYEGPAIVKNINKYLLKHL